MFRKFVTTAVYSTAIWLAILGGSNAFSQTSQGSIIGRVTDASGGSVSGTSIVATNLATGERSTVASNSDGYYLISNLSIGTYTVTATFTGFQTVKRTPIIVATAVNTTVDIELKPGALTEVVTVQGAAPLLQTENAQNSTVIQQAVVADLPLQMSNSGTFASGRRQMDNFIFLTPGVTGTQFSKSFNGSATFEQEIILDGAIASGPLTPGLVRGYSPPYEAIQEFNVQNSVYPAEYPRGFGIINYNTKSGTNQFHGDGFEFLRNNVLDARPFFSKTVPIEKQNEYGFTVGGPVVLPKLYNGKDKTFFFFAYTGFQLRKAGAADTFVTQPTAAMLQGDFSSLLPDGIKIYDPATTTSDGEGGFTRQAFQGNIIPNGRFDSSASKLLQYIPTATLDQPFNNYLSQARSPVHDNAISIKFDHAISSRQKVSYTYFWDWGLTENHSQIPGPLDNFWGTGLPGGGTSVSYSFAIKPNLINSFTAAYMNNGLRRTPYTNLLGNSILGIPNLASVVGFPCFNVAGSVEWGDGCAAPLIESDRNFQIRDTVDWIKGKHDFKFGADIRHGNSNQNITGQGGTFNFSNLETSLPDSGNESQLGFGFASFLLGQVDSASRLVGQPTLGARSRFYSLFAQDVYKITPKFNLNYGVALNRVVPYYDNYYRMSSLDLHAPNSAAGGIPGALHFAGFGPGRIGADTFVNPRLEVSPRLAATYAFNNKTVIRSGWGIYYAPGNLNLPQATDVGSFLDGFFFSQSVASTNSGITPAITLAQGLPAFNKPLPDLDPTIGNGSGVDYYNQAAAHSPTLQSWTFDVQRELSPSTLLDVAYVGQHGYRLVGQLENLNQVPTKYLSLGSLLNESVTSPDAVSAGIPLPYPGFTGSVAQALRPFPQYLSINDTGQPTGTSGYNALQAKLQRRLSNGLNFLISYTLSKTITNTGQQPWTSQAPVALDTYNRGLAKSIAPGDETHDLAISYVYQLPFGQGKHFATSGGVVGKLAGGWEVAGIQQYSSGTPISVTGGGPIPLFNGGNTPVQNLGVPTRIDSSGRFDPAADRYLNLDAFSQPAPYTFGTVGSRLPTTRGFPSFNESISLIKDTHITESNYIQFRVETFNTFNRVIFSGPASNINTPATYGTVSGQANSPRIIQFGLKFFF